MSEEKKKKLICFYGENESIKAKIQKLVEVRDNSKNQYEFLEKKKKQLMEAYEKDKKSIWSELEAEIDAQGMIPGEKAKDLCLEIDYDLQAIKRHDCASGHGDIGSILAKLLW